MSTFPYSPSPAARVGSQTMRPWLMGNCVKESKTQGKHIAEIEIRDNISSSGLHPSSRRRLQPHDAGSQSVFSTTASRAKLRSRPNTAPTPYHRINSDSPSPILDISPNSFPTATTRTYHKTTNLMNSTYTQRQTPGAHAGHNFSSLYTPTLSECVASTSTSPKGEKLSRILRPIKSSLALARKDSSKDQSRRRKISLPSHSSAADSTLEHPVPPLNRNVLKSPRRPRTLSSATTLPLALRMDDSSAPPPRDLASSKPFVDAELGNSSRFKSNAAAFSSPNLNGLSPRERALPPLPTRPHTSSGPPSSHTLLHSDPQTQTRIKRPTTAPAACVIPFDENALLTQRQLSEAASLFVVAENGVQVPFGNLFLGAKIVVIFIRYFWCPLCQDYMFSISRNVNPVVLKRAGLNLVIISNGSHDMIKSYRQIFRTPFAVYIDPTLRVYKALGMTLRTLDSGPESQRGGYVRHGLVGGITMVVKNAIKAKMPVWKKGGDVEQLGGEFVLGPGLKCTFAHRMRTTRSHTPIQRVLAVAGVDIYARGEQAARVSSALLMSEAEEAQWMEERNKSLAKLREKKSFRRGGEGLCGDSSACELEAAVDNAGPVRKEDPPVSPTSSGTCIVDDIGMSKIIQKEDRDTCWHANDYFTVHSAESFPSFGITDAAGAASDAKSSLSSDSDSSHWNYYYPQ